MHSKLRKAMIRIELSLETSTFGETIRMLLQTNGLKERTGFLWRHKKKEIIAKMFINSGTSEDRKAC